MPVDGGQFCPCHFFHEVVVIAAVVLEFPDGDKGQTVLFCKVRQLFPTHHGAVVVHDLTAETHLGQSGKTEQVYRSLGVTVPFQNAAGLCLQREHMSRTAEIAGMRRRVCCHACRQTTLYRRNAGSGVDVVDGNGERRFVVVRVVGNHLGQSQPDNVVMAHGHTDQSLCGACHEVDVFRGGELSGADEVALVFPIRIVCHQNALAVPQILQSFFNGVMVV